ncbi:MAG: ferric iron uptake transcriptional regulator [Burkholderiales bacterium]|nr:ferric iron uptake transcriptional regulator [Burkholderiales bacterium]
MIQKHDDDSSSADLKGLGLKATGPRLKILEIFKMHSAPGTERHLSAEEVYKILVAEGEDVGLATVYRVLSQFAQAGILVRRTFEPGNAVFELDDGAHHDHLICEMCGRVEEFIDPEIEKRQKDIAEAHGFKLHDHSMALYGICASCQRKGK